MLVGSWGGRHGNPGFHGRAIMGGMSLDPDPFECDAECDKETHKAIHVKMEDGRSAWIPKSCLHPDSDVNEEGDTGTLVVQGWWAEDNL